MPSTPPPSEFVWGNIDAETATRRVGQLYAKSEGGGCYADGVLAAPAELSPDDVTQGAHPDCFFIAAVHALLNASPQRVAKLLVTAKGPTDDGVYRARFFKDDSWREVEFDDRVPISDGKGTVLFARSPTKRWWPLLLEKGYAALYGGYAALAGGNIAECLHDLTGLPVRTIALRNKVNPNGENLQPADFKALGARIANGGAAVCAGTLKSFEGTPAVGAGLQQAHAYTVIRIVPEHGGFAVLRNPTKTGSEYRGPLHHGDPKLTAAMRKLAPELADKRIDVFAVPLAILKDAFATLYVVGFDDPGCNGAGASGLASPVAAISGAWSPTTASMFGPCTGGCSSFASFASNPKYVVVNPTSQPVEAQLLLKQPCQRYAVDGTRTISYAPSGIAVVRRVQNTAAAAPAAATAGKGSSKAAALAPFAAASPHVTSTTWQDLAPPPRYVNQRDVSCIVTLPPGESLVVPALYHPLTPADGGAKPFSLQLYAADDAGLTLVPQDAAWPRSTPLRETVTGLGASETRSFEVQGIAEALQQASAQNAPAALSVMLAQQARAPAKAGSQPQPDTVADGYVNLSVRIGDVIAESTVTINYRAHSLVVPIDAEAREALRGGAAAIVSVTRPRGGKPKDALAIEVTLVSRDASVAAATLQLVPATAPPAPAPAAPVAPTGAPPANGRRGTQPAAPAAARPAAGRGRASAAAAPATSRAGGRARGAGGAVARGGGANAARAARAGPRSVAAGGAAAGGIASLYAGLE